MSAEIIKTCDICGKEEINKKEFHWTNRIAPVLLSLKDHMSVQTVALDGDVCAPCGRGLVDAIQKFVGDKKKEVQGG